MKPGTYTISELMKDNNNLKSADIGQTLTIGRMKGRININDNIYKISSKELSSLATDSYSKENKKVLLNCQVSILENTPISINITSANNLDLYKDLDISCTLDVIPTKAENHPLTAEIILSQISKTSNTKYSFNLINIDLGKNLFLPKFSSTLNELRRMALNELDKYIEAKILRKNCSATIPNLEDIILNKDTKKVYSILLNKININFDYSKLENIDNVYIPFKVFLSNQYKEAIDILSKRFNVYIYLPTIMKNNYTNLLINNLNRILKDFKIKGFILSNISNFKLLDKLDIKDLDIVCNYTFNVFNKYSIYELQKYGASRVTLSPELNKHTLQNLSNYPTEMIIYGNVPLMNMNYCLLGESNKCYSNCTKMCTNNSNYYLKDRLGYKFKIIPDNIDTVTTIYNSKTTFIDCSDIGCNYLRIDVLDETIDEINNIINCIKNGQRLEGNSYTNGNLNKEI